LGIPLLCCGPSNRENFLSPTLKRTDCRSYVDGSLLSVLGGFEFRFREKNLDNFFVRWEYSGHINCSGLFFEPNIFGGLLRLDGWSAPVPRPSSDVECTSLSVIQPSCEQDSGNESGNESAIDEEPQSDLQPGSLPIVKVTLSLVRNRLAQRKGVREGGAIGVGSTVGLTGFVDTRYCRCRSVELVYPCVGARSWSHWSVWGQFLLLINRSPE
jgi:hypothetical protein